MGDRRGQSFLEYLLVITAVTAAVVVAAYFTLPDFQVGLKSLAQDGSAWMEQRKRQGATP